MKITIYTGDPERLKQFRNIPFYYPEDVYKHPKLQVDWVDRAIGYTGEKEIKTNKIVTNSDHIINAFRVSKKQGKIEDLLIYFYPFDSEDVIEIKVDRNGELSAYPDGLLDEWSNQLLKLLK